VNTGLLPLLWPLAYIQHVVYLVTMHVMTKCWAPAFARAVFFYTSNALPNIKTNVNWKY